MKFKDYFAKSQWTLSGTDEDTFTFSEDLKGYAVARSLYPNTNYPISDFTTYNIPDSEIDWGSVSNVITGTKLSGTMTDLHYDDDTKVMVFESSSSVVKVVKIRFYEYFWYGRTFDVYFDIHSDHWLDSITLYADDQIIASNTGCYSLSGSARIENPEGVNIYVETSSPLKHELEVDWLEARNVGEQYETFIELNPLQTYFGRNETDTHELEVTRADEIYSSITNLFLYSTDSFNDQTLTWINKPSEVGCQNMWILKRLYDLLSI
ncbi:hypothetical protein ES703_21123 [subsurface metagenome]